MSCPRALLKQTELWIIHVKNSVWKCLTLLHQLLSHVLAFVSLKNISSLLLNNKRVSPQNMTLTEVSETIRVYYGLCLLCSAESLYVCWWGVSFYCDRRLDTADSTNRRVNQEPEKSELIILWFPHKWLILQSWHIIVETIKNKNSFREVTICRFFLNYPTENWVIDQVN